MFQFLKDARAELEHVVWPTPNETKKYMNYNIVVIVVLTIFLMALGYATQSSLQAVRSSVNDGVTNITTDSSADELATQAELDALADAIKDKVASGATTSGEAPAETIATGVTLP